MASHFPSFATTKADARAASILFAKPFGLSRPHAVRVRRLGHGSPAIALSVYAHVFNKADGAAAEAIEAAMKVAAAPLILSAGTDQVPILSVRLMFQAALC